MSERLKANKTSKFLLLLGVLAFTLHHLHGKPANDDTPEEELDNLTADSKGGSGQSITEKIYKINKEDKAPKCLKDGDVMNENCLDKASKRNALRNRNRIWYTRRIPYVLHSSLSRRGRKAILDAIQDFHRFTCIRFKQVPVPYRRHYIRFIGGRGCWSWIGKTRRRYQHISIGNGCGIKGIAIHEIMHALGFYHEQSRYDRDDYIKIIWKNIRKKYWSQFRKKSKRRVTALGLPYDYDGIMHYGKYAFTKKRGLKTIVKKRNTGGRIGQRRGFSRTDILQINRLYSCESPRSATWSNWSPWSSCINFGRQRREQTQRFCMRSNLRSCRGAGRSRVQVRRRTCGSGKPRVTTFTACENKRKWLNCQKGYVLHIIRANYGRTSRRTCSCTRIKTTRCYARRSLSIVRSKCNGKQRCLLHASSRVFGNPCRGTFKYLQVQYQCRKRKTCG